jgi:hypothetical protein
MGKTPAPRLLNLGKNRLGKELLFYSFLYQALVIKEGRLLAEIA